jgi:D-alanyl-D-alanine carboxypeptidase/D-alanyl-D-alanine-endopeptidase (penicillin-binding protein 4)
MQNAHGARGARWKCRAALFALCLCHLAVLSCAKSPAAVTPPSIPVNPVARLHEDILAATRSPGVSRASWGIAVHSLDRQQRLFALNAGTLLVPASVAKLVTVATAADAVGWDYRYTTTLRATGPIVDGVLQGDLLVVGSGDPSIGGRAGDDLSGWTEALKTAGIRRIEGRIIGDDDAVEDPRPQLAWAWDDLGYTTGALFGALNLAENRTTLTVTPGPSAGTPAVIATDPRLAFRAISNRVATTAPGSPQLLWPEQRPGDPSLTIAGSIPAAASPASVAVAVGNPTLWFVNALKGRLLRDGIEVTGAAVDVDDVVPTPVRDGATLISTHRSRTLGEIAKPILKDSVNLYAEALMRLNVAPGVFPTNDAALEGLRKRLDAWGISSASYQLVDGSGLSRRDAISAEAVLAILERMADASGQSPFVTGLPIAGVDGSLSTRMKGTPAENNLRAKTGTMSNIRTLAGYVTTRDGERLAFVILINNFEGTGANANDALDAIAVRLAAFSRTNQN